MVAYTAEAMGLDPGRELTVAGGLGFMGALLNFAAGQALIAMVRRLREHPGELGLVQGNGGHATKHALGVFSTSLPDELVLTRTAESVGDQELRADDDAAGDAVIDGITVEYERSGPTRAVAICRFVDGRGGCGRTRPIRQSSTRRSPRNSSAPRSRWWVASSAADLRLRATTRRRFDLG